MSHRVPAALLAAAVGLSVVACAAPVDSSQTPFAPSGIRGTVLLGPTCPGPSDPNDPTATGDPCTTSYSAQLAVLDGEGKVVAHVTSGADGTFAVDLAPGEYTLAPQNGDPYPTAPSQPVIVVAGSYTEVQVNYDPGIR